MPSKHPFAWLAAVGIVAALLLGHELRQRQDIEQLTDSAMRLLHAPLQRAPELQDIEAARARAFLDGALAVRESAELQGLRDYASALAYYQKEDLPRAVDRLARARRALGDTIDLLVLDAAIAIQSGDSVTAAKRLRAAGKIDSEHPRMNMLLADLALDAGDAAAARSLCDATLKRSPKAACALNRRGLANELLGDVPGAQADFERAAKLDDRLAHAHLNLGRMLRLQSKETEALLAFAEAARRSPSEPLAWLGLGLCRASTGDPIGARMDLEHARQLATSEPDPLLALADLDLAEGQRERAIVRYRAAVTLAPEHAGGWVKLGNALIRADRADEARQAFSRAVTEDDQLAAAHNGRGAALAALGKHEEAALALATAAGLDREDPNPLLNLARLRMKTGDVEAARQAQLRAIERDPSIPPLL